MKIFEYWSQGASKNKEEWMSYNIQSKVARGTKSKCEKCGQIINGGRRTLNRHKRENHSY
jgi:hypothetical protein